MTLIDPPAIIDYRICKECGSRLQLIAENFRPNDKRTGTFRHQCRECERKSSLERYHWDQRYNAERHRQRSAERYWKMRKDPQAWKEYKAYMRESYRYRRVRRGLPVRSNTWLTPEPQRRLPVAPLVPLMEVYCRAAAESVPAEFRNGHHGILGITELAKQSGVSDRSIREAMMGRRESFGIDTADKLCIALGTHLSLVYDEG